MIRRFLAVFLVALSVKAATGNLVYDTTQRVVQPTNLLFLNQLITRPLITNGTAVDLNVLGSITYNLSDEASLAYQNDYSVSLSVGLTDTTVKARLRTVSTTAALVAADPSTSDLFSYVNVLGYSTAGDGGGGNFKKVLYSSVSSLGGSNAIWFQSTSDPTWAWVRVTDGAFINVKWFGAKGDGSTDDTAAIQAAANLSSFDYAPTTVLNNIYTNNATYFPNGFYKITSPITFKPGATVVGQSSVGSKIKTTTQINMFVFPTNSTTVRISTIGFTGPSPYPTYTNVTAGTAITITNSSTTGSLVLMNDVRIDGGYNGIEGVWWEGADLSGIYMTDLGGTGIKISGPGFSGAVNARIKAQIYRANRAYDIANTSGVTFDNCNAIGSRDWGLFANDNSSLRWSGGSFEYNNRAFCLSNNLTINFDSYYVNVQQYTAAQVLTNGTPALLYYNERASFKNGYFVNNSTNTLINAWETAGSPNGEFAYNTYNTGLYTNNFASPTKNVSGGGFNGRMTEFLEAGGGGSANGPLTLGVSSSITGPALGFKNPFALLTSSSFSGVEYADGGLHHAWTGPNDRKAFDLTRVVTNTATSGSQSQDWKSGTFVYFPNNLTGTITFTPSSYLSNANGTKMTVYRGGTGAFNLNVVHGGGTLALVNARDWCELIWTGSTWDLFRYGSATLATGGGSAIPTTSGLTSGRVTFAGSNNLLTDDSDMTFSVDTLTVTKVQPTTIELGHASDTTLARASAGVLSVEGVNVAVVTGLAPSFTTLTDGATVTITCDSAKAVQNSKVTLGGNRTLAISGASSGMTGVLVVVQDGTGSRTLTLPASSKVVSGGSGAITLTTTASAIDILSWVYDGTNYYWTYGKNFN